MFDHQRIVSEAHCQKAQKRYEIKQLECRLNYLLPSSNPNINSLSEALQLCTALKQCYGELLKYLGGDFQFEVSVNSADNRYFNWRECYQSILELKTRFSSRNSEQVEQRAAATLYRRYHTLSLLLANFKQTLNSPHSYEQQFKAVKSLYESKRLDEWLNAIVQLANQQSDPNMNELPNYLEQLNARRLQRMADLFAQKSHTDLINSILFYKLNPELLFEQKLHPEKLISVKSRVSQLYDFIEILHAALSRSLHQRGLPEPPDYLFHGDVLPPGIEIKVNPDCRELIFMAIKTWRVCATGADVKLEMDQLQEIFRAYKFWFNPCRLIDIVMNMQQRVLHQSPDLTPLYSLENYILSLYKNLSTTECLDLYGYFSNKDTNYLIRTLLLVQTDQELDWLPKLNLSETKSARHVYDVLTCVMNALRTTLKERQIETQPYKHNLKDKKSLTPGRRNRQAILRVITLYQQEERQLNARLEELFQRLEE